MKKIQVAITHPTTNQLKTFLVFQFNALKSQKGEDIFFFGGGGGVWWEGFKIGFLLTGRIVNVNVAYAI